MAMLRWALIAVFFLVWTLPVTGFAEPATAAGNAAVPTETAPARSADPSPRPSPSSGSEAAGYAAREQQSPELQSFQGGAVVVYIGSGVLLVALVILLILLL